MFKIIGSAVVILGATILGMMKYNDFAERKRILESLYDGAVKIRDILKCCCPPLHESFAEGGEFFERASQRIREGILPSEAVSETLEKYSSLKEDDKNIIRRFARGLGAEDCDGQISNVELFINGIKGSLSDAEAELRSKGGLYVKGSILTATAVVLLLV